MALATFTVTDDDGSGTTGTAGTNAWLQSLLDVIDGRWSEMTITSTGTQNDLSITSSGIEADVIRCNNASDITITSIAAPASPAKPGKRLVIFSVGVGNVLLKHQETSGTTAANRLINFATSGSTPLTAGSGVAMYVYDDTTDRWRMVAHEQGAWLTPTFAAGNYFASGGGTWTVGSGDVGTQAWRLEGRRMSVRWYLATTTVSGTPASLQIGNGAWGGFTATKAMVSMGVGSNAGGGNEAVYSQVAASGTSVLCDQLDAGTWSNATNTTALYGGIDFEVT